MRQLATRHRLLTMSDEAVRESNIPLGEVIIPAGDRVKLLSSQGSIVNVDYDGYSVPIPATALDYAK